MNYLAHLLLAGEDPERQLGGFIADFAKGRIETLAEQYSDAVLKGIIDHRRIDRFSDDHPLFQASRGRISPERRRVSGIIVDIVYDHFLSLHWERFSACPQPVFIQSAYRLLEDNFEILPARLRQIAPRMIADDWLGSYRDPGIFGLAFHRISKRIRRTNSLAGASEEVEREYEHLEADFLRFFPQAISFVEDDSRMGRREDSRWPTMLEAQN